MYPFEENSKRTKKVVKKIPWQFSTAKIDILILFLRPTVQNPKMFSLLSYKSTKSKKRTKRKENLYIEES